MLYRQLDYLVVHRMLGSAWLAGGGPGLRTRGDGKPGLDPPLDARQVRGRVVALEENLGFAHAANRGAANGREPLLLLLNPDTEVLPGALDELVRGLDDHPEVSGTVPLLEEADGASQYRWQLRRLPTVLRLAAGRSGVPAFAAKPSSPHAVPQPAAAAWLVRREVWDALGGFDEAYVPAWWEDVDFCARLETLHGTGASLSTGGFVVRPSARVVHHGGSSVGSLGDEAFLSAYYCNLVRFVQRHHPGTATGIVAALRLTLRLKTLTQPRRRRAYRAALTSLEQTFND